MAAKKPIELPTLAEYHGIISRMCDALKIAPPPGGNKLRNEFDAVAKWLQAKKTEKQTNESESEVWF